MPLLLSRLHKNTSLFRFHVVRLFTFFGPPTIRETAKCAGGWKQELERVAIRETVKCAGGWKQELERVGYRNRFRTMIRAPKEQLPPLGVWPHALARVAALPDVIFEVLRSKPNLVPS
jgi:hypothetical protein